MHDAGAHAEHAQRLRKVEGVAHRDAEGHRAAIAGQLLDAAGAQGVALLDVDGLFQLRLGEVEPARRHRRQIRCRCNAIAAQGHEPASGDQLRQPAEVDDALEHVAKRNAVGALGRRRETQQGSLPILAEAAELAQHAAVVLGDGVVALVVEHQADVAAADDAQQALLVQRTD